MQRYRRLFPYARTQLRSLALIVILTLAMSGVAALQPWPMKLLADYMTGARSAVALWMIVSAGLALFAMQSALDTAIINSWTMGGRRMVYGLASDLFARLQRRPLLYHATHPVGDTMGRATTDCWALYRLFDALLIGPAQAALTLALMLVLMAHLDAELACIAIAIAAGMAVASFLVIKPLRLAAKVKREIEARIQSHIQQTLTGIPVVQAFAQEQREQERLAAFADTAVRAQQRGALIGSVNGLASGLVASLGSGCLLWVGAGHVVAGRLSIGGLLAFVYYVNVLQTQIKTIAGIHAALLNSGASVDRVIEVLDAAPEALDKADAPTLPPVKGRVEFEDVTFGYAAERPILRNISLTVEAGEIVAIAGASGAGKTTLVNLIPRFFDPCQGRVLVDGRDVREVSLQSLRSQVALVLQEAFLFPVSVAENIAFGKPGATRAEIEAAAEAASALDFIATLPAGFDTTLGERGATLSGGERQRIAIARAFLRNAPILILDEPTSALDAKTESQIFEALERLMKGRTTFLISHRESARKWADRVFTL